jgi:lysophospholipase L1-like esterase
MRLLLSLVLTIFASFNTYAGDVTSDVNLPKVLIIGDSISLGYTPYVKQLLQSEAEVIHIDGNAQSTKFALKNLDDWIGETKWDVIYFNWGLWDICYRLNPTDSDPIGKADKVNGTIATNADDYEKNLVKLITKLKQTHATLIWASTSAVPEDTSGSFKGDEEKYNQIASSVMQNNGIAISDLYELTHGFSQELYQGKNDVHFTKDGYRLIADKVAKDIRPKLKTNKNPPQ